MNSFQLEPDDDYMKICSEVFLTVKGRLIFHCFICEEKYGNYKKFTEHIEEEHQIKLKAEEDEEQEEYGADDDQLKSSSNVAEDVSLLEKNYAIPTVDENCMKSEDDYDKWFESTLLNCKTQNEEGETPTPCANADKDSDDGDDAEKDADAEEDNDFNSENDDDWKKSSSKRKRVKYTKTSRNSEENAERDESQEIAELMKNVVYTEMGIPMCTICDGQIKRRLGLENHMKRHLNLNKFICPICARGYPNKDKFELHLLSRHDTDANASASKTKLLENQCHLCKKILSDYSNLKHHIMRHNEENKKHECPTCLKKFYSNKEVKVHSRIHTNERPYLCNECGSAFKTNGCYTKHMLRHQKKFEYKCPVCNKACISSCVLKIHMTTHKTVRDIKCDLCDKTFKAQHGLKQHMKIHENSRKYCCEICKDRFNLLSGLRSHMKSKHQTCTN